MVRKEFTFLSNDRIHRIHAVRWMPDDPVQAAAPKAVLQITHGMCEYIERYEEFADFLCRNGFVVTGHDHLGHGQSVFVDGELGYMASPNPCRKLLADMHSLRRYTQEKYAGIPYFILGHSMGSYLLRCYLAEYEAETAKDRRLSGAIIMGTGMENAAAAAGGIALCHFLAFFRGWRYRSSLVTEITTGNGAYKKFDTSGEKPEESWLSRNVESVRAYYNNPKCHFRFTLNGYLGLLEAVYHSCSKAGIRGIPDTLPLLVISGQDDPVGNLGEGVRKYTQALKKAGKTKVRTVLLANNRHEILQELDRASVFRLLYSWMEEKEKE